MRLYHFSIVQLCHATICSQHQLQMLKELKRKKKEKMEDEDLDELEEDFKLVKKLKKGKVSTCSMFFSTATFVVWFKFN